MAGRKHTRKKDLRQTYQDANTQTSPMKFISENDYLKKEIELLKLQLKALTPEVLSNDSNQTTTGSRKKQETIVLAVADSPQTYKIVGKGCSCKGSCSTKVCGCVKKQISCGESCKCSHSKCQNQEPDKENMVQNKKLLNDVQLKFPNLTALGLIDDLPPNTAPVTAGPSTKLTKKLQKAERSIFSPDSPGTDQLGVSFTKLQLKKPLKFTKVNKNLTYSSDSSTSSSDEAEDLKIQQKRYEPSGAQLDLPAKKVEQSIKKISSSNKVEEKRERKGKNPHTYPSRHDMHQTKFPNRSKPVTQQGKSKRKDIIPPDLEETASESLEELDDEVHLDEFKHSIIDPMKPTRQLARTPVMASPSIGQSRVSVEVSLESNPGSIIDPLALDQKIIAVQQKKDDEAPQVNWDEHYARLVPCRLCNRTFNPERLAKHEASCKRV
ncbi:uncharacterized protein LOC105690859 [Athalia rosae]|uniref:uncharacterized protein LOC105690859 n=1 Tax=Athalia rosae TaxID=37344 RepID=UPI0020347188|nr:uncharacterized protein LOC105690859 [Athalia rosae]XP_048513381.1 uncharacterized protein LOC105690859 [Athalia rosae]